jgi:site-specific DNA-methyltransferase (adenine-specific)
MWRVEHGDCLDVMRGMPDNSIDAVVTDPPYGLSFMGKRWDYDVPAVEVWAECLRLLKPGGHLLAFAGTRTQHRMAVRIEDAGFEIRDMIAWVYGSGFPKSHDVSKAIDREAGETRGRSVVRSKSVSTCYAQDEWTRLNAGTVLDPEPITAAASKWVGWGTALKPAMEPITVARKPLGGTVAENVLEHGTGGLNVDGCRVGRGTDDVSGWSHTGSKASENRAMSGGNYARDAKPDAEGRWPANLIHDGSEEATGLLGDAARFFYCPKASKADRDEGCEGMEERDRADQSAWVRKCNVCGDTFCDPKTSKPHCGHDDFSFVSPSPRRNHHPTVKPTDLMRYLCRLVTPPGGIVLDPFTGSGSTGKAAVLEGFQFIGIEREAEYVALARARIAPKIDRQRTLFS